MEKHRILPQVLAVSIKNLILISFGMSLGFPTILIPALQQSQNSTEFEELSLNKAQTSWISSINLIFVPLGCVLSGSFSSFLGRKRAMQIVCIPLFASWIIIYFSRNVTHLYIALGLSGFTGGMLEAPVLTYVAEITTPKIRGLLAASGSFCIILGVFSQFLMGIFLKWRVIAVISSVTPILAIFFLFFVPESPYWLIIKNRNEDAKKSLMWLRGWLKNFDDVKQEFTQIEKSLNSDENEKSQKSFMAFTKRNFIMPYLICSFAFLIGHYSGMTTLQTYAVPIFAQLKAPIDKYFATMLLGIVELSGTAVCVTLVKFVGKRKLTFFSLLGCSFCFFSTAVYAYFIDHMPGKIADNNIISNATKIGFNVTSDQIITTEIMTTTTESVIKEISSRLVASSFDVNETISNHQEIHSNHHSWIPLTLMLASAFLSHSGIRLLPWMLVGEIYPAKIRGVASGITGGTSYIFGFSANKLFLTMVSGLTLPGTFLLYSIVSCVGCLVLYILLPETEGRTLQEIEDHFNGNRKLPKVMKSKSNNDDDNINEITKSSSPTSNHVKFDLKHWESNDKFDSYLRRHHINPMKLNPIKNHVEHRVTPERRHHNGHHHENHNKESKNEETSFNTRL